MAGLHEWFIHDEREAKALCLQCVWDWHHKLGLNTFWANTLFDLNASSQLHCWSAPPAYSMLYVFCGTFSTCHLMTKSVEAHLHEDTNFTREFWMMAKCQLEEEKKLYPSLEVYLARNVSWKMSNITRESWVIWEYVCVCVTHLCHIFIPLKWVKW